MVLSDFQKQIARDINSGLVTGILSFTRLYMTDDELDSRPQLILEVHKKGVEEVMELVCSELEVNDYLRDFEYVINEVAELELVKLIIIEEALQPQFSVHLPGDEREIDSLLARFGEFPSFIIAKERMLNEAVLQDFKRPDAIQQERIRGGERTRLYNFAMFGLMTLAGVVGAVLGVDSSNNSHQFSPDRGYWQKQREREAREQNSPQWIRG